jgi:hypothetical protein
MWPSRHAAAETQIFAMGAFGGIAGQPEFGN